jgi:TonB family protein
MRDRLKGNIVTLRVFDRRDTIHFSPDGEPEKDPKLGIWTLDSKVSVSDVSSSKEGIQIKGTRLYVTFDRKDNDKPVYVNSKNNVKLILALAPGESEAKIGDALKKIFVSEPGSLRDLVPDEWKGYFNRQSGPHKDCVGCATDNNQPKLYRVGGGVSAPRALHAPDPHYTEEAKSHGLEGVSTLWAIVDTDGRIHKVRVARPLGFGLDEEAIAAVGEWRFEPSQKDGTPVPVQINIEVNFRLY